MILGIIKHGGAKTVLSFFAHEDLIVNATFASTPERIVLSKLRVRNGLVTEVRVDLHYCQPRCEAKYLRLREFFSAEFKNFLLYLFGKSAFSERRCHNKS